MIDPAVFFREVTLRLSSSLDPQEAFSTVAQYIRDHIPVDWAGLFFDSDPRGEILSAAMVDFTGQQATVSRGQAFLHLTPDLVAHLAEKEEEFSQQKVVIMNDPGEAHPDLVAMKPVIGRSSLLVMFLAIRGEKLGTVLMSKEAAGAYTSSHAELLARVYEPFAIAMNNARQFLQMRILKERLEEDNQALYQDQEDRYGGQVVGAEFGLRRVMELVRSVAGTDSPVLLFGETGTGKEVVAHAIHTTSPRREGPFVRVQCGAIPDTLLDSELFGHEKGAFTGALTRHRGRFERAEGGTIFLDEIGELTPQAQVKLLRVLQEREFERLGGHETIRSDVRVVAATHRDLEYMVSMNQFREDLWFRLNVFPIRLPPLRSRREDIPSLTAYFLCRKAAELSLGGVVSPTGADLASLQAYHWPGNVRELQNVIERALIMGHGKELRLPPLTPAGAIASVSSPFASPIVPLPEMERQHIKRALSATRGKVGGPGGAAELLELNPSTLRARMRKLGIPFGRKANGAASMSWPGHACLE